MAEREKKPIHQRWWFWLLAGFFVIGIVGNLTKTEEQKAAEAKAEAEAAAKRAQEEAEAAKKMAAAKQLGAHCVSPWDGSSYQLIAVVRPALRNPKSFEHIETRIGARTKEGRHRIVMRYRAENGFGGMSFGSVTAMLDGDTCNVAEIVSQN